MPLYHARTDTSRSWKFVLRPGMQAHRRRKRTIPGVTSCGYFLRLSGENAEHGRILDRRRQASLSIRPERIVEQERSRRGASGENWRERTQHSPQVRGDIPSAASKDDKSAANIARYPVETDLGKLGQVLRSESSLPKGLGTYPSAAESFSQRF
jgi:hypothetical protein